MSNIVVAAAGFARLGEEMAAATEPPALFFCGSRRPPVRVARRR